MSVGEMIHHAVIIQAIDFRLSWPFRDLYGPAARPSTVRSWSSRFVQTGVR
jgi:hypothetical protein